MSWSETNLGGKVNSGLDIINTLCDFYGVYAPIFIDNRESVTEIIEVKTIKDRIIKSHFELNNVKEFIKANLNLKLRNIVLVQFSDENSNSKEFKEAIEALTFEWVETADRGLRLELSER